MKWIKKGLIFNPTEHKLANNCSEFAQSPQTLVFENFVRIYFSTRQKDEATGKFLSHISFVDFDKEFKEVINIADKTVIELGELGTFDEHGIFPINILRHQEKIYAYTCGWSRRVSVSVETSTGLAFSDDEGKTFIKAGLGPVLTSSLHEPMLVGDSFVKVYNGVFHMWYIYGSRWINAQETEPPARVYKIAHAVSADGIEWRKEEAIQIIPDSLNKDECQALPTVIKIGSRYHMYFCFREATDFRKNSKRGYRLGYAWSDDLKNWNRDDNNSGIGFSETGWDAEMMCYPHIFEFDDKVYLLYNGNEFGRNGFGIAELETA
jgi:hypothetical protein